jgi:hypothetical protein
MTESRTWGTRSSFQAAWFHFGGQYCPEREDTTVRVYPNPDPGQYCPLVGKAKKDDTMVVAFILGLLLFDTLC